ncbi:DMT family transporter [Candidatus Bathyarchaeota archaeon]|nr:MAG: DMT family transporter [Candidatus Bathyarchaeota archaeon]
MLRDTGFDLMYVELLSLFTALCYGASAVLARMGMRDSNPMTGAMVGTLVQVVLLSGLIMAVPPTSIDWTAIALFIASGILASTLGRLFNYMSIERLGVPVSATIIGSSPIFSTLLAVLFIGERVAPTVLLGTVLVVAGIAITRSGDSTGSRMKSTAILIPIAAAAFYGASSVVRKAGLNILPEATLGALVGAGASLLSFGAYLILTQRMDAIRLNRSSSKYFILSGVVVSAGWLSMFTALVSGEVSVVSALIGTNPLFSIILSLILLRGSEELNWRTGVGCLAIVAGAAVITLF